MDKDDIENFYKVFADKAEEGVTRYNLRLT